MVTLSWGAAGGEHAKGTVSLVWTFGIEEALYVALYPMASHLKQKDSSTQGKSVHFNIVTCYLKMGTHSKKWVVKQFCCYVNIIAICLHKLKLYRSITGCGLLVKSIHSRHKIYEAAATVM